RERTMKARILPLLAPAERRGLTRGSGSDRLPGGWGGREQEVAKTTEFKRRNGANEGRTEKNVWLGQYPWGATLAEGRRPGVEGVSRIQVAQVLACHLYS